MGDKTGIEWTDATWNPIVGCSVISPGCTNCYAMKQAARIERMFAGAHEAAGGNDPVLTSHYVGTTSQTKGGAIWTGKVAIAPEHIFKAPLRWKRSRRVFVNSMGDLFHESVPDEWIDLVLAVMALAPQHVFQVLTKRSKRMREYFAEDAEDRVFRAQFSVMAAIGHHSLDWPLPNVWLGVSAEDQTRADERIPDLLAT